jgi:hypothetical protein
MLRSLHMSGNQSVDDWRSPLLLLAEAVSPHTFAFSRLNTLSLDNCRIGHKAFFYFCRGVRRGALQSLTKLDVSGNGVEHSGVEPLAQALARGALPSLQIIVGSRAHIPPRSP